MKLSLILALLFLVALSSPGLAQSGRRVAGPPAAPPPAKTLTPDLPTGESLLSEPELLERVEFGEISELKDRHHALLITDDSMSRYALTQEFSKYAGLKLVEQEKDAEFFLFFSIKVADQKVRGAKFYVTYVGNLFAFVKVNGPVGTPPRRILWQTTQSRQYSKGLTLDRRPAKMAAREFIAALQRLRGEKVDVKVPPLVSLSAAELQLNAVKKVQPDYPAEAKRQGIGGSVKVELLISEEGEVEEAKVLSGPEQLQAAALEAAREWVFKPALVKGVPVRVQGILTFTFLPDK